MEFEKNICSIKNKKSGGLDGLENNKKSSKIEKVAKNRRFRYRNRKNQRKIYFRIKFHI